MFRAGGRGEAVVVGILSYPLDSWHLTRGMVSRVLARRVWTGGGGGGGGFFFCAPGAFAFPSGFVARWGGGRLVLCDAFPIGGESLAGLAIMAPRVIPVGHEQTVRIVDHHFLGVQNGITRAWGAGN